MKSHLLLIPAILATTAAMAGSPDGSSVPSKRMDAHEQAAALLAPPHRASYEVVRPAPPASAFKNPQESAAALLSGSRTGGVASTNARVTPVERMYTDAQAQAAALLHNG
jgi:hypothetical protein